MAEQPWENYADAAFLIDTDTLLAKRAAGGVEVPASAIVKLNASGNVPIGTVNPLGKLHVNDAGTAILEIIGGNNNGGVTIGVDSTGAARVLGFASRQIIFGNRNGGTLLENARFDTAGYFRSGVTNTFDLGTASLAWRNLYLLNSPTITSDANKKLRGAGLSPAEIRAGKRIAAELCWWQWLDSIADKQKKQRNHFGPMAQDIARIFIEEGVEADYKDGSPSFRSDMLGYDEWPEVSEPVTETVKVSKTRSVERQQKTGDLVTEIPITLTIDGKQVEASYSQTVPQFETVTAEEAYEEDEIVDTGKVKIIQPAGTGWRIDPMQVAFFLIAAINADVEALRAELLGGPN